MCRGKEILVLFFFIFGMGILHLATVDVIISLSALINVAALNDLDDSVERYDESPRLHLENKGVVLLYNITWRTTVYVNLNKIDNETLVLRQYVHNVDMLCQMIIITNWTGYSQSVKKEYQQDAKI